MQPLLRRVAERALVRLGPSDLARRFTKGRVLVLAYHNVVPDGAAPCGERSLHVPRRLFCEQLDLLAKSADVVPLSSLLLNDPSAARTRVVITFDDAYEGAVAIATEELAKRGMPATIFVTPAFLDGRTFWWDAIAGTDGMLDPRLRDMLLRELRGEDAAIRDWARQSGRSINEALPSHARGARIACLDSATCLPGITLAAHTWSHPNLTRLEDAALDEQLQRPLAWLRAAYPRVTIPWISFPYGLEDDRVRRRVEEAGFVGALRISGGWHREENTTRFGVPRLNIPSTLSPDGFALRVAGVVRR
jgi:peptidoglycan/xylan/chitin deacetylase (PgdA/CDA1 family)